MKQISMALAWIAGCAILTPAAVARTARVRPPQPAAAAQKRRQLVAQHTHIGFQKYAQRDLGWAARHFKEALRLDPKNAALHATLGGLYGSRKQLKDAEEQLRTAARLEPLNTEHQERLGVVLERQDRPAAAAIIYKNVIWVDNRDAAAHQHLGWVMERLGKPQEAVRAYQTALRLDPGNLPARARLSRLAGHDAPAVSAPTVAAAPAPHRLASE
jgi:Tfp pilus assembly protein PilF